VSKRGSGSSARAGGDYSKTDYNEAKGAGFSSIESKQIAQAVKLVRETETYKNYFYIRNTNAHANAQTKTLISGLAEVWKSEI
jgi:hypothetical protein